MKRYNMVMLLAIVLIPVALFAIPVAESKVATSHASSLTKQINWSGMMWNVRSGSGGPGPNVWSSSTNNVWVDSNKKLHLKITKSNNKWYCAEISTVKPAKYGTYKFTVDSDPSKLSKDVVAGMFYYLDDQNEIDIEFSRWNDPGIMNTQYTVWTPSGGIASPTLETNVKNTTHTLVYTPAGIKFYKNDVPTWTYTGTYIPQLGGVLDINLWLFEGGSPANKLSQEFVISKMEYTPMEYTP